MFFQGVMPGRQINSIENNNFNGNLKLDIEGSSKTLSNVVLFRVSAMVQQSRLLEKL
jgi:hypothetical protein